MKWLSEDFRNLRALWCNQLRVLLSAEEQIVRALPDMYVHAADEELRQAFRSHQQETEVHIKRLEQILAEQKNHNPAADETGPMKCKAIAALRAEAEDLMQDARDAWVRDAALIAVAQRVDRRLWNGAAVGVGAGRNGGGRIAEPDSQGRRACRSPADVDRRAGESEGQGCLAAALKRRREAC
jgi:ferritin-like metal-binding protein YciE